MQAVYADHLPQRLVADDRGAQIFYAVSVLNQNGRSAGISNVTYVSAVAALAPPSGFRAQITEDGPVFSWNAVPRSPETPGISYLYRVYRRPQGETTDTVVGELPVDASTEARLVDRSFEWEKTYLYRVTVVTVISAPGKLETEFEGDDTPPIQIFAHDVFPPAVPSGLQAVFSEGKHSFVDLIWAPDADADLAGYNVFRHESGAAPVKINEDLVKTPAFRDTNITAGKSYFYSVSAVDVRGNESSRSQEASETVP
jgi:hypothetical protein